MRFPKLKQNDKLLHPGLLNSGNIFTHIRHPTMCQWVRLTKNLYAIILEIPDLILILSFGTNSIIKNGFKKIILKINTKYKFFIQNT